jgi:hypothetical protein
MGATSRSTINAAAPRSTAMSMKSWRSARVSPPSLR